MEAKGGGSGRDGLLSVHSPMQRSFYFWFATFLGICCIAIDIYIAAAHWRLIRGREFSILTVPIGLQVVYQWWRVLRYENKIKALVDNLNNDRMQAETIVNEMPSIARGALMDVLLWSFILALWLLLYVNSILSK